MQRLKETMSERSKDSEVMLIFSGVPSHFRAKDRPCTDHGSDSTDDSAQQFKGDLIQANTLVKISAQTRKSSKNVLRFSKVILCCFPWL